MRKSKLNDAVFVTINANNFDKVARQMGFGAYEDNGKISPTKEFERATGHRASSMYGLLGVIYREPEFTNDPRDIREFRRIWTGYEKSGKYMTMEEARRNFRGKGMFLMENRVYEENLNNYFEELFDM